MRFCYLSLIILLTLIIPGYSATTYTMDSRTVPTIQYATPTTGSTVTIGSTGSTRLILNPAGTLVALTVTLPSSPSDGDYVQLCSSQAITTLTMNGGTIVGSLTTAAIGTFAAYIFNATTSSWFRIG